jgi:hypothetical protein
MTEFERRIWTDDHLTALVLVLCFVCIGLAIYLATWVWVILGGWYWFSEFFAW